MNIILIGFKGSGKTYFGKLLSQKMHVKFIDTDSLIEEKENLSCFEIASQKSENYFRELETNIICGLSCESHIISIGGGAILKNQNLLHLQKLGPLIYLKCVKEDLKKRLFALSKPSTINSQNFDKIFYERIKKYEIIADYILECEKKSRHEIFKNLWHLITSETCFVSLHGENLMEKQLEL